MEPILTPLFCMTGINTKRHFRLWQENGSWPAPPNAHRMRQLIRHELKKTAIANNLDNFLQGQIFASTEDEPEPLKCEPHHRSQSSGETTRSGARKVRHPKDANQTARIPRIGEEKVEAASCRFFERRKNSREAAKRSARSADFPVRVCLSHIPLPIADNWRCRPPYAVR